MSRHFLFCLPVRLGVFVLSFLSLLGNGLTAFGVFFQLRRLNDPPKSILIPAIIYGAVSALCAVLALFGFIGSIIRNRRLVKAFAWSQTYQIGLYIVVGTFYIVFLFTNKQKIEKDCLKALEGSSDNIESICKDLSSTNRWIFLAIFIFQILIQFYLLSITHSYIRQIEETSYRQLQTNHPVPLHLTTNQNQQRSSFTRSRGMEPPLPSYAPIMNPALNSSRTGLVSGTEKQRDLDDDLEASPYSTPYNDNKH